MKKQCMKKARIQHARLVSVMLLYIMTTEYRIWRHRETCAFSYAGIAQRKSNCLVSSRLVGSNPLAGSIGMVLRSGIDMTIDPEELEAILEDLDFMVEIVRQNCGIVSFLSVAHSARNIRQILKSVIQEKDTK